MLIKLDAFEELSDEVVGCLLTWVPEGKKVCGNRWLLVVAVLKTQSD